MCMSNSTLLCANAGRDLNDSWLCTVTETDGAATGMCFSHEAPTGSPRGRRVNCRGIDDVRMKQVHGNVHLSSVMVLL